MSTSSLEASDCHAPRAERATLSLIYQSYTILDLLNHNPSYTVYKHCQSSSTIWINKIVFCNQPFSSFLVFCVSSRFHSTVWCKKTLKPLSYSCAVDYYYVACMICNYEVISNSVTIDYHLIAWVCSMREVFQALILIGHFMLINITIHTIGASSPELSPWWSHVSFWWFLDIKQLLTT